MLDCYYNVYLVGKPVQHFETEIQQLQRNFQQYPRIKMQSFKGFLPKALCSDQAINVLTKRSEEFKKMTHQSSEIASSILKVYETYLLQLPRIMGLLFNDAQVEGQNFYSSLRTVYLEIYKEYQNFTLDHVQTPTNEITNMNSAKYIHLSGCILAFQKIIKSYSSSETATCEMAKKYFKSQKNLMSSIQAYKESFTEAKLVYNIDQKIKRYSTCQQYYKNVALDHAMVVEMKDKLQERKKEVVEAFESLIKEDRACENEIEVKMFTFLSKFNANACDNLKKRLFLSKEGRKKIEKVKIPNFFESFNFQDEQAEDHGGRGRRNAGNLSSLHKGGEHQNLNQIKKLYAKLERFIETRKNQHLKVFDFHLEFYKTAEKKSVSQLKQSFVNLQKNMKKIKEQFSKPTYQELKNTLAFIKQTMDIYIEVQKKIWLKIQLAGQLIEEIKTILRSLTQEVLSMIEKLSIETKDKQSADGHEFKEKMNTISEMINFNDMKLCPIFANLKQIYSEILNIYELGLNDCHDRCHELGKTSEGAFEESLSAIKQAKVEKLKNTSLSDLSNPDHKGQIVFEDEIERNSDFKKLKKPVEIEILEKQKQKVCPEKQQAQKQQCIGDGQEIGPPSKKAKKHKEFIQSKVNFVEGEQFKSAFSCALADKIILQGRLYVTNFRLCFFSNFNPSNVFFGQTFIQIPKKDIITLEKRKNGIFFDNSISITTIKGQVFLTSFFKRNEAYSLICETIGINKEDQAYENPGAIQSDQSELIDKTKGQKNGQADPKIEDIEAEDDIKQSEITERAEAIQKMMDELTYNFKQSASAEFVFPGLTAYKLLKVLILDGEITIGGKKYLNVNEYFKKVLQSHKDIEVSSFTPPIKEYLNPCNIKSTCPLKLCRKMSANVPTPPSNIPFLPKQTKASQKQSLYIISKHKWVLDNEVQSSGAPYTDSFRVYYRTICDSTPQACKITTKMFIHFIKNVMVKSVIESKTQEESALQFKKQYDELRKYFVNQEKSRKKREKVRAEGEALGVEKGEVQGKGDEEGDRVGELEEMLNQAKQKSQLTIKQLRGQVSRYQKMLIAALALNLVFALALLF